MKILLKKQPQKYLASVPEPVRQKLIRGLHDIENNEGDIVRLAGTKNRYRYKIAHYRVIFEKLFDGEIVVVVIEINTRTNIHY